MPNLSITVHFDLVCPWCLIGKRHLRTALEQFHRLHAEVAVAVAWRSQQLLPGIPPAGLPYQAFYEQRLGSPAAVAARRDQVRAAARAAGLNLAFECIEFMPNTLTAHQVIACAKQHGDAEQLAWLIDRLFTAYFSEGRDIGDVAVLLAVAAEAGFPIAPIEADLAAPECRQRLVDQLAAASADQVSGVPFFVFNDRLAISGAHPPSSLLAAMEQALLPAAATPAI